MREATYSRNAGILWSDGRFSWSKAMDKATFDEYVKFAQRSFFSEAQRDFEENPAETIARMYTTVLPARSRVEYLHQLIAESEESKRTWDSLALIAQGLVRDGKPLPVELAAWVADVLEDQLRKDKRRRRPAKGGDPEANRDRIIALAVHHLANRFELPPTRPGGPEKCCAEGGSACDVVGRAVFGKNLKAYKNTERIWSKRDPLLSPTQK